MRLNIAYAVRAADAEAGEPWLVDTCAGGTWSASAFRALTFSSPSEACRELQAAEIESYKGGASPLQIVMLVEEVA